MHRAASFQDELVYQLILAGNLKCPSNFSRGCVDLISKLLKQSPQKRLGNGKGGTADIQKHRWFSGFDWNGLVSQEGITPPLVPKISADDDCSNFDEYPEDEEEPVPCDWDPEF